MDSPSSSSPDSPSTVSLNPMKPCEVCGNKPHGQHYGAITCRACAAFFRRMGISKKCPPCKKNNDCLTISKNDWFPCKKCRLQKCLDIGMTIDNFQYNRDAIYQKNVKAVKRLIIQEKIPPSMNTFLGRSNLIIFCSLQSDSEDGPKCYINLQYLLNKAANVLEKGSETPILYSNSLEKLALGLKQIQRNQSKTTKVITKIGKEETLGTWESSMLKVAKWLTYFDEFQKLPPQLQLELLKGVWKTWGRLEKLAKDAITRRQTAASGKEDEVFCEWRNVEVDISWCSRYTVQQLKFFESPEDSQQSSNLIQSMLDLEPTDVELSYMMCQLCFHQVGKRCQGEILKVTDQLQETLSNHLHDYYVNQMNRSHYSSRIAKMMKINNNIEKCIYRDRVKAELMTVFDIFFMECSHPDLFMNG